MLEKNIMVILQFIKQLKMMFLYACLLFFLLCCVMLCKLWDKLVAGMFIVYRMGMKM